MCPESLCCPEKSAFFWETYVFYVNHMRFTWTICVFVNGIVYFLKSMVRLCPRAVRRIFRIFCFFSDFSDLGFLCLVGTNISLKSALCILYSSYFSKQKRRGTSVRVICRRFRSEISYQRSIGEENVNQKNTHFGRERPILKSPAPQWRVSSMYDLYIRTWIAIPHLGAGD